MQWIKHRIHTHQRLLSQTFQVFNYLGPYIDSGAVFLYEFKLNMLDIMFGFMLSNICYHNKNQRSFLKLKFLFRFMFAAPQK